ncbi:heparinase II/III family protein [Vreelandella venusta]|uniref:heparinase II/III domain-containing protein n=1 Tax=Vreelandella venusta TaxID=44935 RepID=UPI0035583646
MKAVDKVKDFESVGFVAVRRPDCAPFLMSLPFDWSSDPYNDFNWCFQLQTLRYLMVYLGAFEETKDEKYLNTLLEWVKDWWTSAKDNPSKFTWHDMAAGIRAEKLHRIKISLRKSKIKSPVWFNEMLLEHVSVIRKKGFIRTNHNHGLYAAHGLRCLAEHIGPGMKKNIILRSHDLVEEIIKKQFDSNYVHKEHSPHYHHLVLKSLKEYKRTGLYDELQALKQYIDGAENIAEKLYLPDGREIPFGDTDNKITSEFLEIDDKKKCIDLWCDSGYAIYKNGLSYLCVTNNYNSNVHKHWDNLSFIFGEKGQDIFVDPGKYKYTKDEIREKVISSDSHNTINIDGFSWNQKSLIKESIALEGTLLSEKLSLIGCMSIKYNHKVVRFKRSLEYVTGLLRISDEVVKGEGGVANVYSRFVLHKDAEIVEEKRDYISIKINSINVKVKMHTVGCISKDLGGSYVIEKIPVSYSYGSYFKSLSLKIYNRGLLNVDFHIE